MSSRSSFTGKIGFVLAAAGSAVGLGNIWRFPYLAAEYGGGMFLLVYIVLSITFGFSLMIAEISIGRKTGKSAIEAFGSLNKKYTFLGYLASIVPILILPYYSVIGGWVFKYLFGFVTGSASAMAATVDVVVDGATQTTSYFGAYISSIWEPILWFAIFIGLTALIVLFGVEKGIEKVSKVLMPVLIVLILFISIYTICVTDGALDGVKYYLMPDFEHFSMMTVVAATGQLFYSMSLAMGIMITFGSYMKKDISIEKSAKQIELFDTGVAILAGLMIVPAAFAFSGGNLETMKPGPGLMFEYLPRIFEQMPGGVIVGAVFFFMVLLAALTSSISLMETIVSIFMDKFKLGRKTCCYIVLAISVALGLPSALGFSLWSNVAILGKDILSFFDFASNSILMPIVAFITCVFVAYCIKPRAVIEEVELEGNRFKWKGLFNVMIRFVAPICILVILGSAILEAFGVIAI